MEEVMPQDSIQRITSDVVARMDMGLIDNKDPWQVIAAAKEAVETHTNLLLPEIMNLPTILVGIIIGQSVYEMDIVPDLNDGEHSKLILNGE